jgi:hypothetical protein
VAEAAEAEYWSEEAGRRFAAQQDELVALRERVAAQQAEFDALAGGGSAGAGTATSGARHGTEAARAPAAYGGRGSRPQTPTAGVLQQLGAPARDAEQSPREAMASGAEPAAALQRRRQHGGGGDAGAAIEALHREVARYQVGGCVRVGAGAVPWREAALESCSAEGLLCGVRTGAIGRSARARPTSQARVRELEADFASLDALARADMGGPDGELRKAWLTAAAFKKRCVP